MEMHKNDLLLLSGFTLLGAILSSNGGVPPLVLFGVTAAAIWVAQRSGRRAQNAVDALQARIDEQLRQRTERTSKRTNEKFGSQADARSTDTAAPVTAIPTSAERSDAYATTPVVQGCASTSSPLARPGSRSATAPPPADISATSANTARVFLDIEQLLGTNWLGKLGVAVLVLGVSFFLAWQLRQVGPIGKVTSGTLVGVALLIGGIVLERLDRYRLLARTALAGGWALLFFVAYAAHHIAASRVVSSPLIDLVLMLVVAGAMAAHTLRYRSQVVTGLAFALAFSTVAINHVDLYGLSANVILALAVCCVATRVRWIQLEVFGIGAAYLIHYLWLIPIITAMDGKLRDFPQFSASVTILVLYWLTFRLAYVVRSTADERLLAVPGVLNSVLLLGVMKYQTANQELAFWGLLSLGATELILAQLSKTRGHLLRFRILTVMGAALLVAAIPFRFAADYVSPIWLLESVVFLAIGIFTNERVFRRLGTLAAVATALQILGIHGARTLGDRLYAPDISREWILGAIALAAMFCLYAVGTWAPRRWPSLFADALDQRMAIYVTRVAPVLGLLAAWLIFPGPGAAVIWTVLALLIAWTAKRFTVAELTVQASLLFAFACIRTIAVNLPSGSAALHTPFDVSYRLLTVSAVIALGYWLSRSSSSAQLRFTRHLPAVATWAASLLAALLIWYELRTPAVAVAWALLGLVLFETGAELRSPNLRFQGYAALFAAFIRLFIVNLNIEDVHSVIGVRLYTVLLVAIALFYIHDRLQSAMESFETERPAGAAALFAWFSAAAVAGLLRFECSSDTVVIGWAAMTFVLLGLAAALNRRVFAHAGTVLSVATLARGVLHNLYERSYFPWPNQLEPWVVVGIAVALLLASLPFAYRLRKAHALALGSPLSRVLTFFDSRPEQVLFFASLLLTTALLASETRHGMLTVAWGVEALVTFVFALWVKERSYRLAALALLLLCASKIFVFDFWSFGIRDKAVTGIVLGSALLAVSFLYTRHRDAIREFL